jgi:hypothetical protein
MRANRVRYEVCSVKKISLAAFLPRFSARPWGFCWAAYLRQLGLCFAVIVLAGLGGLSSEAGGPPVVLSASSVSFIAQIVNTTSSAKQITLKNRQSVPLTFGSVSITGDFAQINNCPSAPGTLASGASCTFSVTFTPTALGTRTGKLVISDDASSSPQSVSLSGPGTLSGLSGITVTPGSAAINKGSPQQFTATGTFSSGVTSNITNVVTWTSSNTVVAMVSSTGLASGLSAGNTTIQASSAAINGSASLTVISSAVLQSITVTPSVPFVAKGQTQQFVATGTYSDGSTQYLTSAVSWSSSSPGVATISSGGLATSTGVGTTTIAASSGAVTGSTTLTVTSAALAAVAVTPANPSIALGTNQQFTATGTYTDGSSLNLTGSVNWSSSVAAVATISNAAPTIGQAISAATGQTTITATSGSISGSTTLTVTAATLRSITVTPVAPTIPLGATQQFTAAGSYTDGSTQDITNTVTWSSSASSIATISNSTGTNGVATSAAAGQTTVTATLGSNSGSTTLTVNPATVTLVSIALSPLNSSIAAGATQQFTATGTYTDGSTQNLSSSAVWSSSDTAIFTVNSTGLASSVGPGTATATATTNGVSGSTSLTVTPLSNLPSVSCFFQNGMVNGGQSYWGNSVTHDNIFTPRPSEVIPAYQHYGNNAVIFDGPVVHIGTQCLLTSVTYFTGPSPNTDPYQQHFICKGTGATNGQGATVTSTSPVSAGPCAPGDVAVAYTNTYDVGLYCVSNTTGECVYGQLYCNVGPIPYNVAAPAPLRLATFNCNQGAVALPVGDYGVMMATNCDQGSVAAPGGVGATPGGGDKPCLTGTGESGPFGGGGLSGTFNYGTQIYGWKYFTFNAGQWDNRGGHCLLYDPLHDNTIGLPPSLTAYDNGGCSMINGGKVTLAPSGQAPHTIGFTWWSTR